MFCDLKYSFVCEPKGYGIMRQQTMQEFIPGTGSGTDWAEIVFQGFKQLFFKTKFRPASGPCSLQAEGVQCQYVQVLTFIQLSTKWTFQKDQLNLKFL